MLSQCFFPDGTPVNASSNPPMVPCNPSAASSACCSTGDACSADGLCVSSDFFFYRGACTDKDWLANACPSYCRTSAETSVLGGFEVISLCQNVFSTPGNSKTFTCSADTSACSTSNFTRDGVNNPILYGNITGQVATSTNTGSSSLSSTPTSAAATTTVTSPPITKTSPGVIGAAVAIPVILAAILLVVALWGIREYRRRVRAERVLAEWGGNVSGNASANAVHSADMMPLREHYAAETKRAPDVQEIGFEAPRVELDGGGR